MRTTSSVAAARSSQRRMSPASSSQRSDSVGATTPHFEQLVERSATVRSVTASTMASASWTGPEPPQPHAGPIGEGPLPLTRPKSKAASGVPLFALLRQAVVELAFGESVECEPVAQDPE